MRKHLHRYLIIVFLFLLVSSLLLAVETPVVRAQSVVNIWAWDEAHGWLSETITRGDGSTYTTPQTFTLEWGGWYSFTVPSTDYWGNPFMNWSTGETSTTLWVYAQAGSGGTYTAQYAQIYSVSIWAFDYPDGWLSEPITMDGAPTGYETGHTFTGLTETHTFTVPNTDTLGTPFTNWTNGEKSTTIVTYNFQYSGTYTAQYYQIVTTYSATIWAWDNVNGWQNEPIWWNGVLTIYATPHTFTSLTGTNFFQVPDYDGDGNPFLQWETGETTSTIGVSSEGTHTAQYYAPKVATPTFSPPAGTYTSSQSVTLSCASYGATIRYTVDGSEPTSSSTVYSGPISVSVTTTIKAKAFNSGMTDSDTASATYTINIPAKVVAPTFSPAAGTYSSAQSVTVSCATSGATIRYTADGSEPTSSSTVYSSPIPVNSGTLTVKAKAFKSGMTDSDTASATYTINIPPGKVATPVFSPSAGTYSSSQSVTVGCATSGATIRYTTDGSEPSSTSTLYSSPISVSVTTTIKAKAFESGMTDSDTVSATYTINIPVKVATPTFSPPAGTYASSQSVTVSCATSGATIRYTTDGSEPSASSTAYSSPIGVSSTTTIKAKAFKSGMTDSDTASATYTINIPSKVAAPTFSPSAGTYSSSQSVTVSCDTSGATIGYTTDGSEPSSASTVYSGPILVDSGTLTVKAKAFKSGMTDSDTATATYTINPQQVSTPNLSPAGGSYSSAQSVTISCATSEATIRYTVDGSEPTSSSIVYSSPISVSVTTTIKAKAFNNGMTDSDTVSATYTINIPSKVAAPTFSPSAGTYSSSQSVTVGCATSGATITYTVDGSEPTSSSTVYSIRISVSSGTVTVKAKAFKSGMTDSETASATYTISVEPAKVAAPTMSPPGGTYSSTQNVALSCDTEGATIRFTVDGSESTSSSTAYSGSISVGSTTTIKAKAFKSGMTDSDTVSATYTINIPLGKVATPTFNPLGGTYSASHSVALSCSTNDATIRYTTDGSEPSSTTTVYSSPIPVNNGTVTVKAKAYKNGMTDSDTASATYTISIPPNGTPMVPLWVLAVVIVGILIVTVAAFIAYGSSRRRKKNTNSGSPDSNRQRLKRVIIN